MKILEAKVVENQKEDPESEPDQRSDTWLIQAKLEQDLVGWEGVRVDVRASDIGAEVMEANMAGAKQMTIRTRGKPRLEKGSTFPVTVRDMFFKNPPIGA